MFLLSKWVVAIPDYGWVSPVPSTLQEVSSLFLVCEALFPHAAVPTPSGDRAPLLLKNVLPLRPRPIIVVEA